MLTYTAVLTMGLFNTPGKWTQRKVKRTSYLKAHYPRGNTELITGLMTEMDRCWRRLYLGGTCLTSSAIVSVAQYVHRA